MRRILTIGAAVMLLVINAQAGGMDAYIESTGVQAINTGYFANPNTRVMADFQYTAVTAQGRVFGSDMTTDNGIGVSCSLYVNGARTYFAYARKDGVGQWTTMVAPDTERHSFYIGADRVRFVTGTTANYDKANSVTVTRTSTWPIAVFANCRSTDFSELSSDGYGKVRVFALRLYDGPEPVRYFLPFARDGVVGLKDAISGTVYEDALGKAPLKFGGTMGVYEGYDAADCPLSKLSSDYKIIDGKLVDMSYGCFRENEGKLEYRVRVIGKCGKVSVDGGAFAPVVDEWIEYGSSAHLQLETVCNKDQEFRRWRSESFVLSGTGTTTATVDVTGPGEIYAEGRSLDDPYSDACFWLRSIGHNDEGVGTLQASDVVDSLGRTDFRDAVKVYNAPAYSNALVRMPFVGESRQMCTLYLPQQVVLTNEERTAGTVSVSTFTLNNVFENCGITKDSYTIAFRFRPDDTQVRPDYCWLMNFGFDNANRKGFMLGLSSPTVVTNKYTVDGGTFEKTFTRYDMGFYSRGKTRSFAGVVWGGCWHDLVVSVEGKDIRWTISRAGFDRQDLPEGVTKKSLSDINQFNPPTRRDVFTAHNDDSMVPSGNWRFGSEADNGGMQVYTNGGIVAGNSTKCFRGAFQQVALWDRSMSFDEMDAVLSWPRLGLVKIGVEDGASEEFVGGTVTEQNDWKWTFPKEFAQNDSASIDFTMNVDVLGASQRLQCVPAAESSSGTLRIVVNGKDFGEKDIGPEHAVVQILGPDVLVPGQNRITLTRTDAGEGVVRLDFVEVGGSWQLGQADNDFYEFGHEQAANSTNQVCDGNLYDYKRAYFGSRPNQSGASSAHSNMVFRFDVPSDLLAGDCAFRLKWRICSVTPSDHRVGFRLNGQDIYDEPCDTVEHWLGVDQFLRERNNELELFNDSTLVSGHYFGLDFIRLEMRARKGLILVVR